MIKIHADDWIRPDKKMMKEKPKILYSMPGLVPGGGHLGTLEIMIGIKEHGFEPIALVNQMNSRITALMEEHGFAYIYLAGMPGLRKKEAIPFMMQALRVHRTLMQHNISMLHFSDLESSHYGILGAKWSGRPFILHIKNLTWVKRFGWPNRMLLSRSNRIIGISDAVLNAARKARLPAEKMLTIYDGVQLSRFEWGKKARDGIREELNLTPDEFVMGYVGRLGLAWKNDPLVYGIAGALGTEMKNLTCLVVGGPYDGKEETFTRARQTAQGFGGSSNILFLGNRKNVPELLSAMDLLLVPSKEEAFGRVVIEGMASGIPVVGADVGGIPEIIRNGHNGFLRAPDDFDGWVRIVRELAGNADMRKRLGANARKTVEKSFTLERNISRFVALYKGLLN